MNALMPPLPARCKEAAALPLILPRLRAELLLETMPDGRSRFTVINQLEGKWGRSSRDPGFLQSLYELRPDDESEGSSSSCSQVCFQTV